MMKDEIITYLKENRVSSTEVADAMYKTGAISESASYKIIFPLPVNVPLFSNQQISVPYIPRHPHSNTPLSLIIPPVSFVIVLPKRDTIVAPF